MKPILFQLGRVTVRSYSLLLGLGLLLGLSIFHLRAQRRAAGRDRWLDGASVALAAGILGARLGYVAAHWSYFHEWRGEILRCWLGGLNWHGALLGASLGLILYCYLFRLRFWRLADELALMAPIVGTAGWLGCWLAGCAYGRELAQPHWLAADLPDLFGVWALRYNVQLLAAAWSLLAGLILWRVHGMFPAGGTLGLFMFLYGAGLAAIDPLRGDLIPRWGEWRLDVVADWVVAGLGAVTVGAIILKGEAGS